MLILTFIFVSLDSAGSLRITFGLMFQRSRIVSIELCFLFQTSVQRKALNGFKTIHCVRQSQDASPKKALPQKSAQRNKILSGRGQSKGV